MDELPPVGDLGHVDVRDFSDAQEILMRRRPMWLGATFWLFALTLVAGAVWAHLTTVDDVIRCRGRLLPEGEMVELKSLEGGMVTARPVEEGAAVKEGDPILELDSSEHEENLRQLSERVREAEARLVKEQGALELQHKETQIEGEGLEARLRLARGKLESSEASLKEEGLKLAAAEKSLKERLDLLVRQNSTKLLERESRLKQSKIRLDTARKELLTAEKLFRDGGISANELDLKRNAARLAEEDVAQAELALRNDSGEVASLEGELEAARRGIKAHELTAVQGLKEAQGEVERCQRELEAHQKSGALKARSREETVAQAHEALSALKRDISSLEMKGRRLVVKAPRAGLVTGVDKWQSGELAAAGEVLATLVPASGDLVAECWVDNKDFGSVRTGQRCLLKLDAFPHSQYGVVQAVVESISLHPFADEQGRYRAVCRLAAQEIVSARGRHELKLGMQATVEVVTGEDTLWELLFQGFRKNFAWD